MTEDLIEQADMLLKDFNSSGYISKRVMAVLPKLVAEIKRLRAQVEFQSESIQILCRDLDPQLRHLMKGKQELREQLATWQKIAIDEHATLLSFAAIISPPMPEELIGFYLNKAKEDKDKKLPIAAKELNLQVTREAGYVERLENRLIAFMMDNGPGCTLQEAQAALEKIRKGIGDDL